MQDNQAKEFQDRNDFDSTVRNVALENARSLARGDEIKWDYLVGPAKNGEISKEFVLYSLEKGLETFIHHYRTVIHNMRQSEIWYHGGLPYWEKRYNEALYAIRKGKPVKFRGTTL